MSENALAVLDQGRLPRLFQARPSSLNAAAQANVALGFPVVTYRGKVWRLVYQGEEEVVNDPTRPDVPANYLDVVVVGIAEAVSKQYYIKPFVDGSNQAPDCYSFDGVKPADNAPAKQHPLCGTCPQNQWGSRVTEAGKRAKRCQDSKRLAIVPAGDIENEIFGGPMLLRVPPMSMSNLALYAAGLARRGAPIEALVTRIAFDINLAYPQITFTPMRWLTDEEARLVVGPDGQSGMVMHPMLSRILFDAIAEAAPGDADLHDNPAQQPEQPQQPQPAPAPAAPSQPPQPAPPPPTQPPAAAPPAAVIQPAAPRRRTAAFGGAGVAPPPGAAPAPQAAPAQPGTIPNGAAGTVSPAPANMQSAIDNLLNSPIGS